MCPVNRDGLCTLYDYRPMICRLHGLPHMLLQPGGKAICGPGCGQFDRQCSHKSCSPLDRTPLYLSMARLERELRQAAGVSGKIKMTVAQMIANL
jgi:hypothetical protein